MVTLDLSKDRSSVLIDLSKSIEKTKDIKINLQWDSNSQKKSFLSKLVSKNSDIDLDLGCLFEFKDGSKGGVQALGNAFGSLKSPPFIELDKDDRSGNSKDGEWLTINGEFWSKIKRVIVFAFIYEGVPNWSETNGTISVYVNDEVIKVKLDEAERTKTMCGIVLLENKNDNIEATRVVKYFSGHEELDHHFDWGLRWQAGTK